MKSVAFAVLAAATIVTPAVAAEEAPFAGPRVETVVGYDALNLNTAGISNPDGVAYGIGAGYDLQSGILVYGAEVEVTDSSTKIAIAGAKAQRDIYGGVRVGYAMGDTLLYTKLGYTNARFSAFGAAVNADGIRAGLGLEYLLGGNVYAKGEYRYSNYEAGIERHQLLAGVGVRF